MKNICLFCFTLFPIAAIAQINSSSFGAHVDFQATIPFNQAYNVAASDIDGDGKVEITVAFAGPLSVFRNTSTIGVINAGTFGNPTTDLLTTGACWQVQSEDLDGDGKKDLISSRWDGTFPGFSVFRNTTSSVGNISFAGEQNLFTTVNPRGLQLADIDGDGKLDAVACDDVAGRVVMLRNTSTVGSISFAAPVNLIFGANLRKLSIGDFDGDGKKDLAVGYESVSKVAVYQNTSTIGNITFMPRVDLTLPGTPWDVTVADIDSDGHTDIICGSRFFVDQVSVIRNLMTVPGTITASSFAAYVSFNTGVAGCDPLGVAVGNLDNDNKPDIVVTNNVGNNIGVFRNISTPGSFTASSLAARVDFAAGPNPDGVIIADIDGNGQNEIVVANNNGSNVGSFSVFHNTIPPLGISQNGVSHHVQLYPNPAGERATLSFWLEQTQQVKVSLFDIAGREAATIVNKELLAGEHLIIIMRNDLPEGIYFVKMQVGDVVVTEKVLFGE